MAVRCSPPSRGGERWQNFVYIERVKSDDELGGVSIYSFNDQRRLQSVRYAASAKFDSDNKLWRLSQVDESNLTDPKQVTGTQTVSGTGRPTSRRTNWAWWRWTLMHCRLAVCTTM
jgi:lipopolysaccharide export LptBFGC system permease protein LptF